MNRSSYHLLPNHKAGPRHIIGALAIALIALLIAIASGLASSNKSTVSTPIHTVHVTHSKVLTTTTPPNTPTPTSTLMPMPPDAPTHTPTPGSYSVSVELSLSVQEITVGEILTVTTSMHTESNGCIGGTSDIELSGADELFVPLTPTGVAHSDDIFVLQAVAPGTTQLCASASGDHSCGTGAWYWHSASDCAPISVLASTDTPADPAPIQSTPARTTGPPPVPPTMTPMAPSQPTENTIFLPLVAENQ